MTPPKVSKFSSRQFKIRYKENVEVDGEVCNGVTYLDDKVIEIRKGLGADLEAEVLIHETLHQMVAFSGLGLSDSQEENIVDFFGKALVAHMRDNKSYWTYVGKLTSEKQ